MKPKDIILHLRLPFSLFLLPVFLFALSQAQKPSIDKAIWIFVVLHLFVYPASNAYNSYFDKDEGSIGGLEKPPAVAKELFWVAWLFDIAGILLSILFVSWLFAVAIFVYGMVSKAYSHPTIRLKKYPVLSLIVVGFFQGFFIFITSLYVIDNQTFMLNKTLLAATISSVMLWAVYPMTQVYQHEEDQKRGDITISLLLGIRGTFLFTMLMFSVAFVGFVFYFEQPQIWLYIVCNIPTLSFFGWWFIKTWNNAAEANFKNTMRLNLLASLGLNVFYGLLVLIKENVLVL